LGFSIIIYVIYHLIDKNSDLKIKLFKDLRPELTVFKISTAFILNKKWLEVIGSSYLNASSDFEDKNSVF